MAYFAKEYWVSDGGGVTRGDRRGCEYAAYVPDPLRARVFTLEGEVAADVADAEAAVLRLNHDASSLVNTEVIARLLLRAEAVASSRIEGLTVGARRLLHVEAAREFEGRPRSDVTADEVLGNIDAMAAALGGASSGQDVTAETILEIHRRLLAGTGLARYAGEVRLVQNWIGGSSFNPCSAAFVPPPPEMCQACSMTWRSSVTTIRCRPWPRRPWRTPNSRPYTRSSTATVGQAGHSFTSSCGGEDSLRGSYPLSRWCWRHWLLTT
jgi:hypothetical protein